MVTFEVCSFPVNLRSMIFAYFKPLCFTILCLQKSFLLSNFPKPLAKLKELWNTDLIEKDCPGLHSYLKILIQFSALYIRTFLPALLNGFLTIHHNSKVLYNFTYNFPDFCTTITQIIFYNGNWAISCFCPLGWKPPHFFSFLLDFKKYVSMLLYTQ